MNKELWYDSHDVCLFRLGKLGFDKEAAAQLQATADTARVQVQRCKDHVDQLSSTLTSASRAFCL